MVKIITDNRELSSKIVKELTILGAELELEQLEVGDYILSDRVCVERKTSSDFVSSVFNSRIFKQLDEMKKNFSNPLLIIEGKSLQTERNAHPNSIRGALSSIAIDYSIPILWTDSAKETASLVYWIAKREQEEFKKGVSIRGERSGLSFQEKQKYLISGLPGINSKTSEKMLNHFKTPSKVFSATKEELKEVEGIGDKMAENIRKIIDSSYEDI